MLRWIMTTIVAGLLVLQPQQKPAPEAKPADTQPASQPADANPTLRKPSQAEILKNLLSRKDRAVPVRPIPSGSGRSKPTVGPDGQPLLLEGTFLVERPGRLIHENGRPSFVFQGDGESTATRSMVILESQLLETMEREAEAGYSEFIVSGEVTRYNGRNYLLLKKVLRRVANGNLGP